MKKFFLFAMMLITASAFSQNCKYETNGIDKFTGKMTKLTKEKTFIETFNSVGYIAIQKADTSLSIILSYRTSFSSKVTVNDGAELSFLLDNGNLITIKKSGVGYTIKSDQLKKLMISNTKTLRYYYTDKAGSYKSTDIEIKKSNAEDFIDLIKCVL